MQKSGEISGSVNLVRPANTEAFLASKTRRELYTRLRNAYGKFERNEPLNPEDESKTLKILTNFFEEDPYNERVILYLPDKILPDYNSPAADQTLEQNRIEFRKAYTQAWRSLLETGRVDTKEKAASLLPSLLRKSIVPSDTVQELLHHESGLIRASVISQIPHLVEGGWLSEQVVAEIMTENHPQAEETETSYRYDIRKAFAPTLVTLIEQGKITKDNFPYQAWTVFSTNNEDSYYPDLLRILVEHGIIETNDLPADIITPLVQTDVERLFYERNHEMVEEATVGTPTFLSMLIEQNILSINDLRSFGNMSTGRAQGEREPIIGYVVHTLAHLVQKGVVTKDNFPNSLWDNVRIIGERSTWGSEGTVGLLKILVEKGIITRDNFPHDLWNSCFTSDSSWYVDKCRYATKAIPTLIEHGIISNEDWKQLLTSQTDAAITASRAIGPLLEKNLLSIPEYQEYVLHSPPKIRKHAIEAIVYLAKQKKLSNNLLTRDMCFNLINETNIDLRGAFLTAVPYILELGILRREDLNLFQLAHPQLHLPRGIFQGFDPGRLSQDLATINAATKQSEDEQLHERTWLSKTLTKWIPQLSEQSAVIPGFVIIGSPTKGYWMPGSDWDIAMVTRTGVRADAIRTKINTIMKKIEQTDVSLCTHRGIIEIPEEAIVQLEKNGRMDDPNELANLLHGELVDPTGNLQSIRERLIRIVHKVKPETKIILLEAIEKNTINGNLLHKGLPRAYPVGQPYTFDSEAYRKIASLLFISKVCI